MNFSNYSDCHIMRHFFLADFFLEKKSLRSEIHGRVRVKAGVGTCGSRVFISCYVATHSALKQTAATSAEN